jgi:hypothetical protein
MYGGVQQDIQDHHNRTGPMVAITDKIAASVRVDFDHASDVVYVSLGEPVPDEGEGRPNGVVARYSLRDNSPSGVTIVGFVHNGWDQHLAKLSEIIGQFLNVDPSAVSTAIMREVKKITDR